jgi:hypothetical protein
VLGFFSSLRSALYGEHQKEQIRHNTLKRQKKVKGLKGKKLGILEMVEEVGVENIMGMSASPAPPLSSRDSSVCRDGIHHV